MPELPEVEVVRLGLTEYVTGRTVAAVEVRHPRSVRRHLAGELDFACRLAGHLKKSLAEVLDLTQAEWEVWRRWYQRNGFDVDQQVWSTANAGAATANAMGAKVSNRDIVPRFTRPGTNPQVLIAVLSSRKGVKVSTYGR